MARSGNPLVLKFDSNIVVFALVKFDELDWMWELCEKTHFISGVPRLINMCDSNVRVLSISNR